MPTCLADKAQGQGPPWPHRVSSLFFVLLASLRSAPSQAKDSTGRVRSRSNPGGRFFAALLLILLLACALRFYRLDAQSLWNDEGTSIAVAGRDLATITRDAAHDIHPPLYYWLLHGWLRLTGDTEFAARSFSALLGLLLVALTCALGRRLIGRGPALLAAFLAAVHPFQVYYAQEARMYMLLAVLTAGAVLALTRLKFCAQSGPQSAPDPLDCGPAGAILDLLRHRKSWLALILLETAGLYTHYSFFFIVLILNLAYAFRLWRARTTAPLGAWALSQAAVGLLYLPWLPIAARQITAWPAPDSTTAFLPALAETWRWLVFGPTIETAPVIVPLALAALLTAWGAGRLWLSARRRDAGAAVLLLLWLGLPVVLMFALGLYREAYLKFLLVATPAVTLLLANSQFAIRNSQFAKRNSQFPNFPISQFPSLVLIALLLIPTGRALHNYYADPAYARDDYRSIAAYIQAVGREGDAVLLNAPGQQEVFGYYYDGPLPVYPLPESRPPDRAATEAALAELAQPGGRVFAVLWATDESDPERIIEGWLDAHAYKALDSWYGNVRLVVYAVPGRTPDAPDHTLNVPLRDAGTGDEITLLGYSLADGSLAAGDIAPITLFWQTARTPTRRYKVFLHLLDEGSHIVGQRDAEPGGGALPTTRWPPGEVIADNYGLPIHPATPPGRYRLEVGLYDAESGQRLRTPQGEGQVWLEPLTVNRPPAPAPIAALGMQHRADAAFGELTLLGYDRYKLGFAHRPEEPLKPGDVLHIVLYWRAETQPAGDWRLAVDLVGPGRRRVGGFEAEPVGGYPTGQWRAGDVWRGQFNLPIPADAPPGRYTLTIRPIAPDGTTPEPFETAPWTINR